MKCAGCKTTKVKDVKYYHCSSPSCKEVYCSLCTGIRAMAPNRLKTWICPLCQAQQRKPGNNATTPVRNLVDQTGTLETSDATKSKEVGVNGASGNGEADSEVHSDKSGEGNGGGLVDNEEGNGGASIVSESTASESNDGVGIRAEVDAEVGLVSMIAEIDDNQLSTLIRSEISKSLRSELPKILKDALSRELAPLQKQVADLIDAVSFIDGRYDDINRQLQSREEDIKSLLISNEQLKVNVKELTSRLSLMEQYTREANIEINGIPEFKSENLPLTLVQIGKVASLAVDDKDILSCFRVAKTDSKSSRPRTVIAKLRSPRCRDDLLAAVSKYNRDHKDEKLNSSLIGIGGEKSAIFLGEHLTPERRSLHAAARIKSKEIGFKFVWVRNGKIYMRKAENLPAVVITSVEFLNKLV